MYKEIAANKRTSFLLIAIFAVLIVALGYVLGEVVWQGSGYYAVPIAVVIAIVMTMVSYYKSDSIVLTLSRARPADKREYPYLVNTVEGLAISAGLPMPRCYVIDDTAPNAFATGRDPQHAVICVTSGLLEKMNRQEVEGVIGHEMGHIKNYDIRLQMLVAVMVGIVVLMADFMRRWFWWGGGRRRRSSSSSGGIGLIVMVVALVLAILAPLFAMLIRMAISRRREFLADASGAMLTRYPEGLANALEKIAADTEPLEAANRATAHLYIVNPFKGAGAWTANLFNTHPPIAERVRRLREM
jgi:heat shock protein HtpX